MALLLQLLKPSAPAPLLSRSPSVTTVRSRLRTPQIRLCLLCQLALDINRPSATLTAPSPPNPYKINANNPRVTPPARKHNISPRATLATPPVLHAKADMPQTMAKPLWSSVAKQQPKPDTPVPDTTAHKQASTMDFSLTHRRDNVSWADDEDADPAPCEETSSLLAQIQDLNVVITQRDAELADLKSTTAQEIQELKNKHAKLLELYDSRIQQVASLQDENAGLRDEKLALQSEISALKTEADQAKTEHEDNNAEVDMKQNTKSDAGSVVESVENVQPATPAISNMASSVSSDSEHGKSSSSTGSAWNKSPTPESGATHEKTSSSSTISSDFPELSPASTNGAWPVFVTRDTVKHVTPVPPPKKLVMGIDMSKYVKNQQTVIIKQTIKKAAGAPSTKPTTWNVVPDIFPDKDMRKMSFQQRKVYGNGPEVKVMIGSDLVGTVPMAMFKQCSEIANTFFNKNATSDKIVFEEGNMTKEAAFAHLEWMEQHTWVQRVWSVTLDAKNTHRYNLELVQAARVMGLHNMYVGHFTRHYCSMIRSGKCPSFELMALVVELQYPDNDPIFDCLAANIAIHHKETKDSLRADLDKFLEEHKVLADRVERFKQQQPKNGRRYDKSKKTPSSS